VAAKFDNPPSRRPHIYSHVARWTRRAWAPDVRVGPRPGLARRCWSWPEPTCSRVLGSQGATCCWRPVAVDRRRRCGAPNAWGPNYSATEKADFRGPDTTATQPNPPMGQPFVATAVEKVTDDCIFQVRGARLRGWGRERRLAVGSDALADALAAVRTVWVTSHVEVVNRSRDDSQQQQ
jgi:hypothetical protein